MRQLTITAAILACVLGAAAAQDDGDQAPARWVPEWEQQPSARDFANTTPSSVMTHRAAGAVHLCCTPRANRALNCRVAFETPQEQGFGSASLRVAREFRLT